MISFANQWTGFYMTGTSFIKELIADIFSIFGRNFLVKTVVLDGLLGTPFLSYEFFRFS